MKAGLLWILWGIAMIIFGLVTIWPWPWCSAWSSWVCVGEGGLFIIIGIAYLIRGKK